MNINNIVKECLEAVSMVEGERHLIIRIDHDHNTVDGCIERDAAPTIRFKKTLPLK